VQGLQLFLNLGFVRALAEIFQQEARSSILERKDM
jgi:hypothetical protein